MVVKSVGGFTTIDGRSILVTPEGKEVGSADPTIRDRGRGGGGRGGRPSLAGEGSAAARQAELARAQEALRQAQTERKTAEQARRNLLVKRAQIGFRNRLRDLNEQVRTGQISRKQFKDKFVKFTREGARQQEGFTISQGALTSKDVREKFQKDVKAFEKAQGSKITDKQLTTLLARKTVTGKQKKIVGPQLPMRAIGTVEPFVRPSLEKRVRIRLQSGIQSIVSQAGKLNKSRKDIEKEISGFLKRSGFSDKNIEKFLRLQGDPLRLEKSPGKIKKAVKAVQLSEEGFVIGAVKGLRDEPSTAVLAFGAGKAIAPLLKFVGGTKVATNILRATPTKVKTITAKTVPKALITSYAVSSGLDVAAQPKGKRAERVGGIFATEIGPFELGARSGVRGILRREMQTEINREIKKLPKSKQDAFNELIKKSDLLQKTKTTVRDVDLKRLKRIPDKAKAPIIKFLKKNDIIVGGSLGQQTAVDVKRSLEQSDMDLYLEGDPTKAAKNLAKKLQDLGFKRVNQNRGQVTIKGNKAIEFHNIDRLLANIESVVPAWKNPKSFITRTKNGIRVPKITVQLKRKLVGGFTDPKRAKDLKDARDILNQLFKRAELQARSKFLFREKNIKQLEKAFGVKISRKTVKGLPSKNLADQLARKFQVGKAGRLLPTTRLKKGIGIKKLPSKGKAGERGGRGRRTVSRKVKRPSQKPSQARSRPSQLPRPSQRPRVGPSQPLRDRGGRFVPTVTRPSQPPTRPTRRVPPTRGRPSQPPTKPPIRRPLTRRAPIRLSPRSPPTKPRGKPPVISKGKRKVMQPKRQRAFDVFGKDGKKFIKLSKKPLSLKDARDRGSFAIDHTTSRTLKIVPKGIVKNLGTISRKEKGHFQRNRKSFRKFRIVKGKRKELPNKIIERTSAAINTRGEKNQLKLSKLRRQAFGFGRKAKKKRAFNVRKGKVVRTRQSTQSRVTKAPPRLKRDKFGRFQNRKSKR